MKMYNVNVYNYWLLSIHIVNSIKYSKLHNFWVIVKQKTIDMPLKQNKATSNLLKIRRKSNDDVEHNQ